MIHLRQPLPRRAPELGSTRRPPCRSARAGGVALLAVFPVLLAPAVARPQAANPTSPPPVAAGQPAGAPAAAPPAAISMAFHYGAAPPVQALTFFSHVVLLPERVPASLVQQLAAGGTTVLA